jgi:hypothetical protein
VPDLDIFSQGLVERESGGCKITAKGRLVLEFMKARPGADQATVLAEKVDTPIPPLPQPGNVASVGARRANGLGRALLSLLSSDRSEGGCQIQAVAQRGDEGEQQFRAAEDRDGLELIDVGVRADSAG